MATTVDFSKYRNPDMPLGYVKKEPELIYKEGIEIDGVHYVWAPYIYEMCLEERDDCAELSDLGFMSDSEEEIIITEKVATQSKRKKITFKKEEDNDNAGKKVSKHKKKGHDNTYNLDVSLSHMNIDGEKHTKKKSKIKQEHKKDYKIDSSASTSHREHSASTSHREHSASTSHREHGASTSYRPRSPSTSPRPHSSSTSHRPHSPSTSHRPHSSSTSHRPHSPSTSHRARSPSTSHRAHSPSTSHRAHSPSASRRQSKIVTYSPSPSPERYPDVKVKPEPLNLAPLPFIPPSLEPPKTQHLFGSYECEVCNIVMNSLMTYNTHIVGKKHRKVMKMKNIPVAVTQCMPPTAGSEISKYPQPAPGIIRKKVKKPAHIQQVIEANIKKPCPGLNLVTEIQGISGTSYYCSLCDSLCSSNSICAHLIGYKHQLRSVKHFKPGAYEKMQYTQKHIVEREILNILSAVQKREGIGRMAVEVEELDDGLNPTSNMSQSREKPGTSLDYLSQPSTSRDTGRNHLDLSFKDRYDKATVPDINAVDFYCHICQSHMNSADMWDSHIRGKRHLTNLKKNPGDKPSKSKTVKIDRRAFLLDRIKSECSDEPFVGLQQVKETIVRESNTYAYQCFLCGSCHTEMDILEHLISMKHRNNYLMHIDFPGREVTSGMSDSAAYALIREMCIQVEEQEGPGVPEVHIDKSSLYQVHR